MAELRGKPRVCCVVFHCNKDRSVIKNIRNEVEDFEYRTRTRTEKQEAKELKP